jgi:hypothetical protein
MHLESTYEVYDKLGVDISRLWISTGAALKESDGHKKRPSCGPVEVNHLGGPYKAHFLVVFGFNFTDENYLAYSAPCVAKSGNSRPLVGYVIVNFE